MARDTSTPPLIAGVCCYLSWGFAPLVFQTIGGYGVGSWEILAHRSLWGVPFALLFVLMAGQGAQFLAVLRKGPVMAGLALSALLIGVNWALYVWAVNAGNVLEASLGYYLTPVLNMLAGVAIFRERLDRIGIAAVILAVAGIGLQGVALGHLPWISLILAGSFGAYGVVRKMISADAQTGLLVECLYLAVPGSLYLAWMAQHGGGHFGTSLPVSAWLMKSAFQSVPADLESAALVDGCSRLGAFFRIAVPLALPGIAATTVFAFISAWDEYLFARTFVSNSIYWVVSVGLGSFTGDYSTSWQQIMAVATLSTLPPAILFLFVQRAFVDGIASGGLKG